MMRSIRKISKAVIALAGYGTRFLPASKNLPKQMFPIIDKPIVQYLVEELVASGIEDIILVTKSGQHVMEDYFDNNMELESSLAKSGNEEKLQVIREVTKLANFVYVRQKEHLPYGNGTPLLVAENLIDEGESFIYMFGDDITISKTPATKQLMKVYEDQDACAVLAVQKTPRDQLHKYGTVKYKEGAKYEYEIESIMEKLPAEEAPSDMAQFGRFVLSSEVIKRAKHTPTGKDNELWLTDIINSLAQDGKKVIAQPIEGEWITTGDPLNFLKATLKFAMQRKDLADELRKFIKENI